MNVRVLPFVVPCEAASAQRAYLDRGDADEATARLQSSIHAELYATFLAGLAGSNVWLPYRTVDARGDAVREHTQPIADALVDAFDQPTPLSILREVLEHSTCPVVAKLRVAAAAAYAELYAEGLAELRSQQ